MTVEPYRFVFEHEAHARRFVERLAHYLIDLAIYRDGVEVTVLDGGERCQREEIYRYAKASSASFAIKLDMP